MIEVHHLGLRGSASPWAAVVPCDEAGTLDLGGQPVALSRGPNFYLSADRQACATAPRPVNAPGIAHLCVQTRDGAHVRAALEGQGAAFLSPPVALGTGYLYAYGHDGAGRLFELETASFLPAGPPAWFGHVAFVSADAERLAAFYGDLLGVAPVAGGRFRGNAMVDEVAGLPGVDVEVWWVRTGSFTLEFWRYNAPPAPAAGRESWYTRLGLQTDDLDAVLAGRTADARSEGHDGRAATIRDLDGNRLLIFELNTHARDRGVAGLPQRDVLARAAAARTVA